jgi:hypothetical protein
MTWLTNENCECPICRYSMDNIEKKISSNDASSNDASSNDASSNDASSNDASSNDASSNDADNVIDILHLNFDSILHY